MNAFTPVDGSHLRKEEKKDVILSLIFLTKKRYGRMKGRACAEGSGQCGKPEKEDAASPTVATGIIFIISSIDSH